MQSSRTGQTRAILNTVQDRYNTLQQIEQQMIELAQLFQDIDALILQQDFPVTQIEQKGEEAVQNLSKGNDEIAAAVTTARKTRRKKWICFGIVFTIIVVVVVVAVAYIMINKAKGNDMSKRTVE
ncbi:putative snare protein [Phaeoacremonium minimum UCRPA7]|uniref:Putative snare protein n=1 Tax=Phaeoacremonium minimum (strain UCR-PA7) TaxID=1286976 RepID=R8BPP1_PHAM7|nr:putative snare protein [Phaeoacremonium minimum UCRPA7]EOO01311.1 putative snare protein [Phaeoacremonium minimum UCRPA7]